MKKVIVVGANGFLGGNYVRNWHPKVLQLLL